MTPKQDSRIYLRLLGFVKPYQAQVIIASLAMLVVAAASSGVPLLVEPVMDKIFVAKDRSMLLPIALGIVALFTIKGLAWYIQGALMGRVGHQIIANLRKQLLWRVLEQDLSFFHKTASGEIVSRITFDTTQVQNAVTRALTGAFQHIATILGLAAVLFYQNWKLAAVAFVIFPLAVYPLWRFGKLIRNYSRRTQEKMGLLNALLYETVSGIRVVKIFRIEHELQRMVAKEIDQVFDALNKSTRIESASHPVMEWIGALGIGAVILAGGHFVIDGVVTTGEFFGFTSAVFLMYDPVRRMNGTWQQVQQGVAAAERIFAWLDQRPSVVARGNKTLPPSQERRLDFRSVSFCYNVGGPMVLSGINLTIAPGKTIAIVGPSGAGKSTLADLVARFYDPSEGGIYIDGIDIRDLPIELVREQIAMVDQQTVLFDATVAANIGYGRPGATMNEIQAAAQAANAADFIQNLPEGFNTMIGENGVTLSGGQRQRIAIARAILKNAPILILDEATSALDTQSERELQAALETLLAGRTALVIAHRLSTIKNADEIIVLEQGRIKERGNHQILLAQQGLYYQLWRMQSGSESQV